MHKYIACAAASLLLMGSGIAAASPKDMTLAEASAIRDGCLAYAAERDWKVAVTVHNDSGDLVTLAVVDGTVPAILPVAKWKGRAAARFRLRTSVMREWGVPEVPEIATVGGGVPVFRETGEPIGGVGVSGQAVEDDVACAEAGITAAKLRPNSND